MSVSSIKIDRIREALQPDLQGMPAAACVAIFAEARMLAHEHPRLTAAACARLAVNAYRKRQIAA
jgi:hypothetical protein